MSFLVALDVLQSVQEVRRPKSKCCVSRHNCHQVLLDTLGFVRSVCLEIQEFMDRRTFVKCLHIDMKYILILYIV